MGSTWKDSEPFWGLGSAGRERSRWALQGHAQVCGKNVLAADCGLCQDKMEAPSVPSESGNCASQVLKTAAPHRPPPRGCRTVALGSSGLVAPAGSEPRVPGLLGPSRDPEQQPLPFLTLLKCNLRAINPSRFSLSLDTLTCGIRKTAVLMSQSCEPSSTNCSDGQY